MRKVPIYRIKEIIVEVTPEEEEEYLGMNDFVCFGCVDNYQDLVNSKIYPNEIGYIIENRIKKRIVARRALSNLETRRMEMAKYFQDHYDTFLPYWKYGKLTKCEEKEIGRMLGCRVILAR